MKLLYCRLSDEPVSMSKQFRMHHVRMALRPTSRLSQCRRWV